jgi:hypothetical protein
MSNAMLNFIFLRISGMLPACYRFLGMSPLSPILRVAVLDLLSDLVELLLNPVRIRIRIVSNTRPILSDFRGSVRVN